MNSLECFMQNIIGVTEMQMIYKKLIMSMVLAILYFV